MQLVSARHATEKSSATSLLHTALSILADLSSHGDEKIRDAAFYLSVRGETENERERGSAFLTLMEAVASEPKE